MVDKTFASEKINTVILIFVVNERLRSKSKVDKGASYETKTFR